ncbi:MAG: COX15/CtaA family protein [Propionibacteriaceae bacterium]
MEFLSRLGRWLAPYVTGTTALRRWSVAALVSNIGIVVTGALVRLTKSGLGCPTWPQCVESSYVPHGELGLHGVIEFGNRLLTFVLIAIVVGTWFTAWRLRDAQGAPLVRLRVLTTTIALGIPFQGVIGGITVLTDLNPFVVAFHLLCSLALIVLCVKLVHLSHDRRPVPTTALGRGVVLATFVAMSVAVWLGTIVTGSGPHAGDEKAVRTGFDPVVISHVHAIGVYVTVALTLACILLLRSRAAVLLLVVELAQGVIGFTQYYNGLPIPLVLAHLLGAALAMATVAHLLFSHVRAAGAPPRLRRGGVEETQPVG